MPPRDKLVIMDDIRYYVLRTIILPNGWWFMPASPAPADPGWDDDLAWLDRNPERECWLDREHDDQLPDGTFRWTTPSGRTYDTEPTRYPI
jgi:hypothetical protein